MMNTKNPTLELSPNEAWVFADFLFRLQQEKDFQIVHEAEREVISYLLGSLITQVPELISEGLASEDRDRLLQKARDIVASGEEYGGWTIYSDFPLALTMLKEKLITLYEHMLMAMPVSETIVPFCIQWGNLFPIAEKEGLMFIGKATNGWVTTSRDVNVLFGESDERIFNRDDQMNWVTEGIDKDNGYNPKRSAFWRLVKSVTAEVSEISHDLAFDFEKNWPSTIAWSNLYKVSAPKGNPSQKLKEAQLRYCQQILLAEINALSPKCVIFLTSGWEPAFLKFLNGGKPPQTVATKQWGKNYQTQKFIINDIIFISSSHPQGKPNGAHCEAICELIVS